VISLVFSAISILGPIIILVPQIRRIITKKSIEGLDLKGLKMGITATFGWLIYGISSNLWLISLANVIGIVLLIWIANLFTKVDAQVQFRSFVFLPLGYSIALLLLSSQSTFLVGLICSLVSSIGPLFQVVRVFKDLNLFGLSATTYINAILVHISWIFYGFQKSDPFVFLPNFYGISIASLLLLRILKSRMQKVGSSARIPS